MATLPIFYSDKEETLHKNLGRELVETLVNQTITLYILDDTKTKTNMYGETVGRTKAYKTPITIKCRATVSDIDLEWDGGKTKIGRGELVVHIYLQHITELETDYPHISFRRGYYIKYLNEYYKIHDDGIGNREITRHLGGDRRFYRTLVAKKVTPKEFDGR